jgi:hypothetical protein
MNHGILIFNDMIVGIGYLLIKMSLILIAGVLLYFLVEDVE